MNRIGINVEIKLQTVHGNEEWSVGNMSGVQIRKFLLNFNANNILNNEWSTKFNNASRELIRLLNILGSQSPSLSPSLFGDAAKQLISSLITSSTPTLDPRNPLYQQPLFPSSIVTPYVHDFVTHVPTLLTLVGELRSFSCQSLELMNNLQGAAFFRANSRRAQTTDIEQLDQHFRQMIIPTTIHRFDPQLTCQRCRKTYSKPAWARKHVCVSSEL